MSIKPPGGSEPFIAHRGHLWRRERGDFDLFFDGPFCSTCKTRLNGSHYCVSCKEEKVFNFPIQRIQEELHALYEVQENADVPVITLDNAISNIKDEASDENHKVKVYLSQKDGRKSAMVLIIDRKARGEKSHVILDLEKEQVRHDTGDLSPGKIVAAMKVWFPESEHEIVYQKKKQK